MELKKRNDRYKTGWSDELEPLLAKCGNQKWLPHFVAF